MLLGMGYDKLYIGTGMLPKRKLIWKNILFFGITTLLAVVGLPLYAYFVGLKPIDWIVFFVMAFLTMMSTTFGYHRLFAHRSFKAHPIVVFLNLFFGAGTFGGSALIWASQHRDHHRFTDTPRDPYNIQQGFWHAHMGWFLNFKQVPDFDNAKDLTSNKMLMLQHRYWVWWAITAGIALPLAVGLAFHSFWGVFFLGVCGRFFVIHQSIFFINSACHMFGRPTYDMTGSAKDSWILAVLTHGEGYHSFHHRFPSDFRNGVRWYHWDPTKWMVKLLNWLRLTWDLKATSPIQIMAARSRVEHAFALKRISDRQEHANFPEVAAKISESYKKLEAQLKTWEAVLIEKERLLQSMAGRSHDLWDAKMAEFRRAKENFFRERKIWLETIEYSTAQLQLA